VWKVKVGIVNVESKIRHTSYRGLKGHGCPMHLVYKI